MATSFRKTGASKSRAFLPSGTKHSVQNSQLLVSTGVPSIDVLLGGGIAVGTIFLVEEDVYGSYARILCKYFLAEGIVSQHAVHVSSADRSPAGILRELPASVDESGCLSVSDSSVTSGESDALSIAWRYQNQPKYQSERGIKFGHFYDLSKTMDESCLRNIPTTMFDASEERRHCIAATSDATEHSPCRLMHPLYSKLWESIKSTIGDGQFSTSSTVEERKVLRIVIEALGSPLWGEDDEQYHSLAKFLFYLKGLLRMAYAVALITIPTHLMQDTAIVRRLEHLCDTVVALESFEGSDKMKNPVYRDYNGLFHVRSLPRINSLMTHMPETLKWAFKLRRRKFSIEKLHLPPELSETASRAQGDLSNPASRKSLSRVGERNCQGSSIMAHVKGKPMDALEF
ncbi:elongator complex protein 4-like [Corticium candelabrum]|uniref:elongator complex protein 4-like n=1 Tax=Corticium candelabrum TaxID=121492 RepID=UPI002E25B01E|nr:elongator complex protein 4-like [Corticium candelabrum]